MMVAALAAVVYVSAAHAAVDFDVPFFTDAQAVGDGTADAAYTVTDSGASVTWQAFSSTDTPPAEGTTWDWTAMSWNVDHWERAAGVSDGAPGYYDGAVLRIRQSGGFTGVLAMVAEQDGFYSVKGTARIDSWGPVTASRLDVYKVNAARNSFDQLLLAPSVPDNDIFNFAAQASLQNISMVAGDYLVFSFLPSSGSGSLRLDSSDGNAPTSVQYAIPEPATMAMIGVGALTMLRRRA